jgi:tryptophan halogenase
MDGARALRTIAVVGGGAVAFSAALAFARALPRVRVGLVETPLDPAALADRMPGTLPAVGRFHAAIGVEEIGLVRGGAAVHRLGTRFERWSASGETWHHVFGEYGLGTGPVPFHQIWLRAKRAGRALAYDRYAAAAVLAAAGKFVHPADDPASPLSTFLYGLRLDPERYRARLAAEAARLPLLRAEGEVGGVERRGDGAVAALLLRDGRRFEADLYIDCTGPAALLLSACDDAFEDWAECLPCDRLLLAAAPPPDAPGPLDLAAATSVGWRWSAPLHDRSLAGLAYAGGITTEGRARRVLASEASLEAEECLAIRPGRRPRPWVGNVLALGDAAVALDPLEGANLSLAQTAIERALELLPGRDCHPLELAEYNRRTAQETERVRDFIALHYLRSGRAAGEFWQAMAGRRLPGSLARTLEQFGRRGRLPFFEEDSFEPQSWLAVLIGMGVLPAAVAPIATAIDEERAAAGMERLAARLAALPERLPPYRDYLARMARGAA